MQQYQSHCFPKNLIRFLLCVWNSELTGDLKYFVNGLKCFADILIKDGDDAIKITQINQPLRSIPGLMNFVVSAHDLLDSKDLTREEYATLVIAIFAGHTVIKALHHLFQNRLFRFKNTLNEFHAENSFHLRDLVRIAKKPGLRMPQDSSMLKKPSSTDVISPVAKSVKQTQHGREYLPRDLTRLEKIASTDAIISMDKDAEEAQHGSKVLNIKITGPDKTTGNVANSKDQLGITDEERPFIQGNFHNSVEEEFHLHRTPPDLCEAKPPMLAMCDWDEREAESIQRQRVKIKYEAEIIRLRYQILIAKNLDLMMLQDSSKKIASTDAIISMAKEVKEAQHGSKVLNIKITGPDKTTGNVANSKDQLGITDEEWPLIQGNFHNSVEEEFHLHRTPPDLCEAKPPMLATCDWDEHEAERIQRPYVKIKAPGGGCVVMNSLIAKGIGSKTSPSSLAPRSRASAILATITDIADEGGGTRAVGLEPSLLHSPTLEVVLNNSITSWGFRPSSLSVVAKVGTVKMLEATQTEECGISADAANAGIPTGSVGDYLSKAILVLLCVS